MWICESDDGKFHRCLYKILFQTQKDHCRKTKNVETAFREDCLNQISGLSPLSLATGVADATLGESGLKLGTQTGAGGTATLA